jgi:hypothetical protein
MWKGIVIAAATLTVVGTGYLAAQPAPGRLDDRQPPVLSREDATAYMEARIAALHSGLQLTPDQERLWPAFEKAYRDTAKLRIERRLARREQPRGDALARLQTRADAATREGAALKSLADAAAPLWQSFDDGQKRRFTLLSRPFDRQARLGFLERGAPRDGVGRDRDGFGFGGGPRDDDRTYGYGRGPRDDDRAYRFGPFGRYRGDYGFGRRPRDDDYYGPGPRDYGYYGPGGRGPRDYFRDYGYKRDRRGDGFYGRDFDGAYGRAPFRWRRDFDDRGRFRGPRGERDDEIQGDDLGDSGDRDGRLSREDEEQL